MRRGLLRACTLVTLAAVSSGCIVLLGAMGAATGARYIQGSLEETLEHPVPEVFRASKQALYDLGLPLEEETLEDDSAKLESAYIDGKHITISLKSATDGSTKVSIRLGGGDKRRSELILENIKRNL